MFFGHQLSGLFSHMTTSRTLPMAPLRISSTVIRASMLERPWLPSWVTTPACSASRVMTRHSCRVGAIGFCR